MFYDPKIFIQLYMIGKYLGPMFRYIQQQSYLDFTDIIKGDFKIMSLLFGLLIAFQLVMQVVLQWVVVQRMKQRIIKIKLLLKLIPSEEIIALKKKVSDLNAKTMLE